MAPALLLLLLHVLLVQADCGSQSDLTLDSLYIDSWYSTGPDWVVYSGYCTPAFTPGSCNTTCAYKFQNSKNMVYTYDCNITDLYFVNRTVANLQSFSTKYGGSCACYLPSTPPGKYLNGYTLTVFARFERLIDPTVVFYKTCEVTPSYQDNPLQLGGIISQTFILDATYHENDTLWIIFCIGLALVAVPLMIGGIIYYFKHAQNNKGERIRLM